MVAPHALIPTNPVGLVSLVSVFLAMAALGTGIRPKRLVAGYAPFQPLVRCLLVALVAVPLTSLTLAIVLDFKSAVLAGFLLIGISPGAPLALRRSREAGSHADFALLLQVMVAGLAIVAVPAWIFVADAVFSANVDVSFADLAVQIFIAQILPLTCGALLSSVAPDLAERLARPMLKISAVLLILLAILVLWTTWRQMLDLPLPFVVASAIVTTCALALGHWAGGPVHRDRVAGAIVCALRNPGIALLVASVNGLQDRAKIVVLAHVLITTVVVIVYVRIVSRSGGAGAPAPAT